MRKEIEQLLKSGITAYKIGKDTGIPINNIQAFINGKRKIDNMTLSTAVMPYDYYKKLQKKLDNI